MKKKPVMIILSVAVLIALVYIGTWLYLKNFVWKKHLPDNITSFTIEKSSNRTYYHSQPDDKYYTYTMSEPSLMNFPWYCSFSVIGSLGTDDDHVIKQEGGQPQYIIYPMSGSDFDYSIIGHLGFDGRIHHFSCNINSYSADDQFPKNALIMFNSDLSVQNVASMNAQELALYNKVLPEIKELRDNLYRMFSLE